MNILVQEDNKTAVIRGMSARILGFYFVFCGVFFFAYGLYNTSGVRSLSRTFLLAIIFMSATGFGIIRFKKWSLITLLISFTLFIVVGITDWTPPIMQYPWIFWPIVFAILFWNYKELK